MKVLYLSEWYPSEKDKMAGLFVQKHAEAVAAQGVEVRVNTWWPEADVVQLNVLTLKKGLMAYVLKRVFGIPYIIIEHWSCYLPENGSYARQPRWHRALLEEIAREASGIYPVSQKLEDAMKGCGLENKVWGRMENVVDDFFYSPFLPPVPLSLSRGKGEVKQLLHVSCFDEAPKNVKGLLRAVKAVSEKRQDFCLTLVGTGKDWQMCRDYAVQLGISEDLLRWTGELTPKEVCREMQKADVFVLPSRWETYGVPLAEAMAVGIPAIETDTCGLRLTSECGLSIPADDDAALANAVEYMLDHHQEYDRDCIRQYGTQYRYDVVGKKMMDIYIECVQ